MVTQTIFCSHCASPQLTRNGKAPNGKRKYLCHSCGKGSRQDPAAHAYPDEFQARVLAAYHERCSQRGVSRIFAEFCFGISRETLVGWLKKASTLPPLQTTLAPVLPDDVLDSMSCGRSCASARTSAGSGWRSADGPGRS